MTNDQPTLKLPIVVLASIIISFCNISLAAEPCHYDLPGDANKDCVINFPDFVILAHNWLIDCSIEPLDPSCIPLDLDMDGFDVIADCNDSNPEIFPGAIELCGNGVDDDCDGLIDCQDPDCDSDQACASWWYYDADADGYGNPEFPIWSNSQPPEYSSKSGDCDDADHRVHPNAVETWYDGMDQNCDGLSDYDADGDGYDSDRFGGTDCDDTDPSINPAATEICGNQIDDDCDGLIDEDCQ